MKRTLVRLGLAALVSSALFGCGSGGGDGIDGKDGAPAGPVVTVPVTIPGTNVATLAAAEWADLKVDTTTSQITAVTINSPPEVTLNCIWEIL